jgi:hypothetical protein
MRLTHTILAQLVDVLSHVLIHHRYNLHDSDAKTLY